MQKQLQHFKRLHTLRQIRPSQNRTLVLFPVPNANTSFSNAVRVSSLGGGGVSYVDGGGGSASTVGGRSDAVATDSLGPELAGSSKLVSHPLLSPTAPLGSASTPSAGLNLGAAPALRSCNTNTGGGYASNTEGRHASPPRASSSSNTSTTISSTTTAAAAASSSSSALIPPGPFASSYSMPEEGPITAKARAPAAGGLAPGFGASGVGSSGWGSSGFATSGLGASGAGTSGVGATRGGASLQSGLSGLHSGLASGFGSSGAGASAAGAVGGSTRPAPRAASPPRAADSRRAAAPPTSSQPSRSSSPHHQPHSPPRSTAADSTNGVPLG